MEKVLLTGATGFIGKELSKKLIDKGYEVHALERYVTGRYSLDSDANLIRHYANLTMIGGKSAIIDWLCVTDYVEGHLKDLKASAVRTLNKKMFEEQRKKILNFLKREAKLKEIIEGNGGYVKGFWHGYVGALTKKVFSQKAIFRIMLFNIYI